jgi:hypothetical protein
MFAAQNGSGSAPCFNRQWSIAVSELPTRDPSTARVINLLFILVLTS